MKKSMVGLMILLTSLLVTGCIKVHWRIFDPHVATVEVEPTTTATQVPTPTKTATPNRTATAAIAEARIAGAVDATLTALALANPTTEQSTSTPSVTNTVVNTPTKTRTPQPTPTATGTAKLRPTNTQQPTVTSTWTPTPSRTPKPTPVPAIQMRIRIVSSSDFTTVSIPADIRILSRKIVTRNGITRNEDIQDHRFFFEQSLERAEAGETVELVQDITFTDRMDRSHLTYAIDKGCIGETDIEIFNLQTTPPTLVKRSLSGTIGCIDLPKSFRESIPDRYSIDVHKLITDPSEPTWKPVRLKLTSGSDWASVYFSPTLTIAKKQIVQINGSPTVARMNGRTIDLYQPLEVVQKTGNPIEMVIDIWFDDLPNNQELAFIVAHGCINDVTVEIFDILADSSAFLKSFKTRQCNDGEEFSVNFKEAP